MAKGRTSKRKAQVAASNFPTYKRWMDKFPDQKPTVRILFGGLFLFSFDGNKKTCQVGIHNTTQPRILLPQHPQPHDFRLYIEANGSKIPSLSLPTSSWVLPGDVHIDVDGAATTPAVDGAYVFAPKLNANDDFNRTDKNIDQKDWRWVLDYEGPFLHTQALPKNSTAFAPSIYLSNGLFYTAYRTNAKFNAMRGATKVRDLGFVGESVAANIYLKQGGSVSIKVKTKIVDVLITDPPLLNDGSTCYDVFITNLCHSKDRCARNPSSHKPNERNDYYLYYDLLNVPSPDQFEIVCYQDCDGLRARSPRKGRRFFPFSTDPAPCGPAGAGGSSGG